MRLTEVRQGIADALAAVPNLRVYSYVADAPQPPCAIVGYPDEWLYDVRFTEDTADCDIPVTVYVGAASDRASQSQLDAFTDSTGTTSLKAAIEADRTLGGSVGTCRVARAAQFGKYGEPSLWIGFTLYVKVYG